MKVIVNEKTESEKKYPYIGIIKNNSIVLFNEKKSGTVLRSSNYEIGFYTSKWDEELFTPFTGEITLSND